MLFKSFVLFVDVFLAAGSVTGSIADALDDSQTDPSQCEPVPLKNRVAWYQAAVSRKERIDSSSGVYYTCTPNKFNVLNRLFNFGSLKSFV